MARYTGASAKPDTSGEEKPEGAPKSAAQELRELTAEYKTAQKKLQRRVLEEKLAKMKAAG